MQKPASPSTLSAQKNAGGVIPVHRRRLTLTYRLFIVTGATGI